MGIVHRGIVVTGVVQGVGFRPFVWRLAHRHGLAGWVENTPTGVAIHVQGEVSAVDTFCTALEEEPPPLAAIDRLELIDLPIDGSRTRGFVIHETAHADRAATVAVPPDMATCAACLADVDDPANRRHGYPFTNCTDCGPRFTIITALPYDRPHTTMRAFTMCAACAAEYADPVDRRFHAQPNACPTCGPTVWFTTPGDPHGVAETREMACVSGNPAIEIARGRLRAGDVLAIKGIGGFHVVCDATNHSAVERLRERKHRVGKPLAVMVATIEQARACAVVDDQEQRLLESRERPIVLVRKQHASGLLAEGIAPGNDFIGIMLPYAPLHHLLCAGMPPLVMTSGNVSEEPIAFTNAAAAARLGPLVDGFLMHDREICLPCDDSVVRCVGGAVLPIRRSRGYAPLPIRLGDDGPTVLAVGGELKAAICLARGREAFMGPHVGDMGNLETLEAMDRSVQHLLHLFAATPDVIACDMHPGYLSSEWARRQAEARGIPIVAVQHHEAHVASLVAEHGMEGRPLIGVCFDGTGYGRDGTIQGGEVFTVQAGVISRVAHLRPFALPGGDASIREPWRVALALLDAAGIGWHDHLSPCRVASAADRRLLYRQLETHLNCPATTSMGRLFDAVAALAGIKQSITYEAEAAMNLEARAAQAIDVGDAYPLPLEAAARDQESPLVIDWRPAIGAVVHDVTAGVEAAVIARRFHEGVVRMIVDVCGQLRIATGISTVGLTGGVFQNALLVTLAMAALRHDDFDVVVHDRVPPNDGGLALGQAVLARAARRAAR